MPPAPSERVDAIGPEDGTRRQARLTGCERIADDVRPFIARQQGIDIGAQRRIVAAGFREVRRDADRTGAPARRGRSR